LDTGSGKYYLEPFLGISKTKHLITKKFSGIVDTDPANRYLDY
jgi:hypothetical protein